MSEREKRQQRKLWRKSSKEYRQKKKAARVSNTPPDSKNETKNMPLPPLRKNLGRKIVRKDRARAYRTIERQKFQIKKMKREIDKLRKKIKRDKGGELISNIDESPRTKVKSLVKGHSVPLAVRKKLLFGEVMTTQLKNNADKLQKNTKEREVFQKCISGTILKKYRLLHMAKRFLPKNRDNTNILKSDRKAPTFSISQDVRKKIVQFYESDEVSRICPGKKDYVIRRRIKKQRRLLLDTVKKLYPKFVTETGIKLSYATLLREKPFWVVSPTARDRDTCLCVRHTNFEFMINKLISLKQLNVKSTLELIEEYSCNVTSYDCMFGACVTCREVKMDPGDNQDTVTYFQWQTVKEDRVIKGEKKILQITKKVPITSTIKKLKFALATEISNMKKHIYSIYKNNKVKRELRLNLDRKEIMMQIDFAENYVTKYAQEIQSTHFGASKVQLTIHTGVYYAKCHDDTIHTFSFATVSDNLDHQAHAVWAHMKSMLEKVLDGRKHVNTLHIFSDGPTSQYRNRTNIYLWIRTLINHFKQITTATWTFSEPGHGKGPMDGIGGVLKRSADKQVLMGKDIKTSTDFVNLFLDSTVSVHQVTDKEIIAIKKSVPKSLDAIPGIKNITKIMWQKSSDVSIKLYQHDRFQKEMKLKAFTIVSEPKMVLADLTNVNSEVPTKSIYRQVHGSSSSDEEDLQTLAIRLRDESNNNNAGTSYGQEKENMHPNLINPNTFLLINVPTENKNTMYRYAAIAGTTVDEEGEIRVTFLSSQGNSAKMFKVENQDVSYVSYEQIMNILPTPQLQRQRSGQYYYFEENIDIFEK